MTHICVSKLTTTGSDSGFSPRRRQAIIWTNAGILLIGPLGTNFSEIVIEIDAFSFKKMHLKMSSGKWQPFCLGLNVLTPTGMGKLVCVKGQQKELDDVCLKISNFKHIIQFSSSYVCREITSHRSCVFYNK